MTDRPESTFRRVSTFGYTVATQHTRHQIHFRFDQFDGTIVIRVDDTPVVETRVGFRDAFPPTLTRTFSFDLGESPHRVTIEARRRLFLAYLRPLRYRILIDDQHVASIER